MVVMTLSSNDPARANRRHRGPLRGLSRKASAEISAHMRTIQRGAPFAASWFRNCSTMRKKNFPRRWFQLLLWFWTRCPCLLAANSTHRPSHALILP